MDSPRRSGFPLFPLPRCAAALLLLVAGGAVAGELEEVFSPHVTVRRPMGAFSGALIKAQPGGEGWRAFEDGDAGFRLQLPPDAKTEKKPEERCAVRAVLADSPARPRPVFRVDAFPLEKDSPEAVDEDYVEEYGARYPEAAFAGKFQVTDSGLVLLKNRAALAMVGGSYRLGATPAVRVQCVHLTRDRQIVMTFDCAESEWERHAPNVARTLLSFEPLRRRGR